MVNIIDTKKEFSLMRSARSLVNAGRGFWVFIKTTPNSWIQISAFVVVIGLGIFFDITKTEWLFLILVSGLVIITECINTAIEIDINLTSPEYHPYAKDTKDVAAGAVLLSAILSAVVGLFIFGPYFARLF